MKRTFIRGYFRSDWVPVFLGGGSKVLPLPPPADDARLTTLGGITQALHSGHCTALWAVLFEVMSISRQAGQEKFSITSVASAPSTLLGEPGARGFTSIFRASSNRSCDGGCWTEKGFGGLGIMR